MTRRTRTTLAAALTCILIALMAPAAHAAAIRVNTTEDELNADCSLREALQAANLDSAVSRVDMAPQALEQVSRSA